MFKNLKILMVVCLSMMVVPSIAAANATSSQKSAAQQLIEAYGYTCTTVDGMNPFLLSEGWTVYCNGHRYVYYIENKGGNWRVEVK